MEQGTAPDDWLKTAPEDLAKQLDFLVEIDALKTVIRANPISTSKRLENSAEHSWHLAMFALILADHSDRPVDIARVIKMLLLHDIIEIDVGDVPIHASDTDQADIAAQEDQAAQRIFGLLPDEQGQELLALWREFEAAETDDARFAKSVDRFQPVVLNHVSKGGTWADYNVTRDKARAVCYQVEKGSKALWERLNVILDDAVKGGWLRKD